MISAIFFAGNFAERPRLDVASLSCYVKKAGCAEATMELRFRLEEVLGRDVDLVLKDALKPRLKPIIEKEVRYV